ncbi:Arm DNA-binding domain-containing protein [Streptomyces sp. NBC_01367]|uniref:Arm DNA-binding domain-containing protein n=1 Tax=Streptomyces sp. NBC_01367 TaxID=2903841 RepID=UPI00386359EA
MSDPITKITLKNGTTRYRFVTDGPRQPNGKRRQIRKTYDTKKEARDELARIRHQSATGTFVVPNKLTLVLFWTCGSRARSEGLRKQPPPTTTTPSVPRGCFSATSACGC